MAKKTQKKITEKKDNRKELNKIQNNQQTEDNIVEVSVSETKKISKEVTKKEDKKRNKKNGEKFVSAIKVFDNNRKAILFGVVGFLIATLLFRCILWPDRIATLKDGTQPVVNIDGEPFTADDLYNSMKKQYSVDILLNEIDNKILVEKYPDNEDMNKEVNDTAEYYYSVYEQNYGYTKETFLSNYGFDSENDFIENLKLDYRRNKYYEDYAESLVTEKEIDDYYKDEVFGDVDSKHILVKVDNSNQGGLSDTDAKNLSQEIINKLNEGKTWDEVVDEYKDRIVHEELGFMAFNASLESSYLKECKNLEVGKYSKSPVATSYGYHIVYKIEQKEKPSLDDVKDDVIELLATQKKNNDTNLYYKSLVDMREKAKLEFVDTKLRDEYEKLINNYK